jgi:ABC-2 type transport system permease protein
MNVTIARITARGMLGGKRPWLLGALSLTLVAVAVAARLLNSGVGTESTAILGVVGMSTFLPLFGLIVGTGVIGSDIDDGSIIHLLSKPISRHTIVQSKLAVAVGAVTVFAAVPMMAGAGILGAGVRAMLTFGVGAFIAGALYAVIFVLLSVITRHAVVLGLVYALVWESLVGSFVPGARNLSVQQWALAIMGSIAPDGLMAPAAVGSGLGWILAVAVFAAATWYAGRRLRVLTLAAQD